MFSIWAPDYMLVTNYFLVKNQILYEKINWSKNISMVLIIFHGSHLQLYLIYPMYISVAVKTDKIKHW